eukprot:scaffold295165_cov36-Tisochrysis_lutea.AAC.1
MPNERRYATCNLNLGARSGAPCTVSIPNAEEHSAQIATLAMLLDERQKPQAEQSCYAVHIIMLSSELNKASPIE